MEYETRLEQLRLHRRKERGITGKKTLADYCIPRRIHFIYERATRKFRWAGPRYILQGTAGLLRASLLVLRRVKSATELHAGATWLCGRAGWTSASAPAARVRCRAR